MQYGKIIPNLTIDGEPAPYGVVNERAIRATAGIMFVIGFTTLFITKFTGNETIVYVVVSLFWLDFFLKTVFGPEASYFGMIGRFLVRGQKPEYVGAIQKRFAWSLGLAMATTMIIIYIILGIRGIAPFIICGTCLTFMWMESALGICAGCKIYSWLLKKNIIPTPKHRPACPGGACALPKK